MANTNNNNTNADNTTLIRGVFFVAVLALTSSAIFFLKKESDIPLTPQGIATRDSLRNIAHPDTTEELDALPKENVVEYEQAEDSVTQDIRIPTDAGYEDGYYAGITDGVTGDERASYDESSQFPKPADRRSYADAYRRGYAQGYADGLDGKDFGISPQIGEDNWEEESESEEPATKEEKK